MSVVNVIMLISNRPCCYWYIFDWKSKDRNNEVGSSKANEDRWGRQTLC